ncbi:uracil-DNA glycosylase [Levilinea saccharolytica]|uniref:Type-5 uracil-DNA glycosylase n=1 Tax=Levilinea saccharolytica TaxID=229921 RepID=A0A0P6XLM9_9CHLR|nr:uracil-DNA glycosylase [Levilinea saccharolytica]KPL80735.1 uracil-DNA glycosylase [Levilinea saccharolytica]GAP17191.1 uracil-DNA glycosylase [Levilinea saccharolytica]
MNAAPPTSSLAALEAEIEACRLCPRLVSWREEVARVKRRAFREEAYWGRGVPGFGDPQAQLLIVGLAPGAHGSNRTGRMFTGDASGEFLYGALHRAGLANQPTSLGRGDGLTLRGAFITAVARCAPPDNKPTPEEIRTCLPYLRAEMGLLRRVCGIVALGKIAFDHVVDMLRQDGLPLSGAAFGHGVFYDAPAGFPWLLASYHPSRQNTQTGRLTRDMFDSIWLRARALLPEPPPVETIQEKKDDQ